MERLFDFHEADMIPSLAFSLLLVMAEKPTVDLFASVADEKLKASAPENGVVTSEKEWEKLVKAWGIEKPAKVDFTKELLVIGTHRGSQFKLTPMVDDKGDLKVLSAGTKDLRPGFRYRVLSIDRTKVKSVNGKPLKE